MFSARPSGPTMMSRDGGKRGNWQFISSDYSVIFVFINSDYSVIFVFINSDYSVIFVFINSDYCVIFVFIAVTIETSGADTGFGRGRGQKIVRWDNGVSREATEGGFGGLPQENLETEVL